MWTTERRRGLELTVSEPSPPDKPTRLTHPGQSGTKVRRSLSFNLIENASSGVKFSLKRNVPTLILALLGFYLLSVKPPAVTEVLDKEDDATQVR
eukprot:3892365-Pyramimonas_sp.AAC.1